MSESAAAYSPVTNANNKDIESNTELSPDDSQRCCSPCLNILEKFARYRYYSIPFIIPVLLVVMIVTCRALAPSQHRSRQYFHISNLGNWQSGVSFFSVFMVLKAILIYFLIRHVFKARVEKLKGLRSNGQSRCYCVSIWCHKFSIWCLPLGLTLTGCFQQSFNKPFHNIGLILMGAGVFLLFLADFLFYYQNKATKLMIFVKKVFIGTITIISFVVFFTWNERAKMRWEEQAPEGLRKLNKTECPPKYDVDAMFRGDPYPYYYPCKSKTLWSSDDPGWSDFCVSAVAEIFMFFCVAFYSFTFWGYLKAPNGNLLPEWITHMFEKYPAEENTSCQLQDSAL